MYWFSTSKIIPEARSLVTGLCTNTVWTQYAHRESRMLSLPPALTPAATKKLIERRNDTFEGAVREFVLGWLSAERH